MVCQYAFNPPQDESQSKGDGCMRMDYGFAVCDPASDYAPRNPADSVIYKVATERLSVLVDGRLLYRLRHRWRNGATHLVFEPLEFVAKLAALVPPPMFNLVRYHGLLSPAARWRSAIVPFAPEAEPPHHDGCSTGKQPDRGEKSKPACSHPRNYSWAELMKRVWELDVLKCDRCDERMRILAAIHSPDAFRGILECLGLPTRAPPICSALRNEQEFAN
jgi:hypothetical protein